MSPTMEGELGVVVDFETLEQAAKRGEFRFVLEHADTVLMQGACPAEKVGWVFYYKCDAALDAYQTVLAIAAGEQALTWAMSARDVDLEGRVRLCMTFGLIRLGRVGEAASLLEGYLRGMRKNKPWRRRECLARFNLGFCYRQSGHLLEAAEQYKRALAAPDHGDGLHPQIRQNLAWVLLLLNDTAGAREQLGLVAESVREDLSLARLTSLWVDRAALYLLEGNLADAKAACQQVLHALDEKGRAAHLATTYVTLGRIALAEGNTAQAQEYALLGRTHAEKAERWDLHNEATRLHVSAAEKGGGRCEESGLAYAARLLVISRSDQ